MWKYVSRRVKDTIELGINVRKSFSIQQNLSNQTEQQHKQHERQKHHLDNSNFIPRHQDPSRDKHKRDERFKKKYDRLHHNQRCLLKALSWVRPLKPQIASSIILNNSSNSQPHLLLVSMHLNYYVYTVAISELRSMVTDATIQNIC